MTLREIVVAIGRYELLTKIAESNLEIYRHQIEALKLIEPDDVKPDAE